MELAAVFFSVIHVFISKNIVCLSITVHKGSAYECLQAVWHLFFILCSIVPVVLYIVVLTSSLGDWSVCMFFRSG